MFVRKFCDCFLQKLKKWFDIDGTYFTTLVRVFCLIQLWFLMILDVEVGEKENSCRNEFAVILNKVKQDVKFRPTLFGLLFDKSLQVFDKF